MPQDERAQQQGARYRDLLAAAVRLERESVRLRRQSEEAKARAVAARQRADQALVRWLQRRASGPVSLKTTHYRLEKRACVAYPDRDGMSPRKLGTMLKRLRERAGMSQAELSRRSRVAQGYISSIEAGKRRNPGIETLQKLAKALGVEVGRLLE